MTAIKAGIMRDVVGLDRGTAKTERDRVADQETMKNLDTRRLRAGPVAENGMRSVTAMNRIGENVQGTGAGTGAGTEAGIGAETEAETGAETGTVHDEVGSHVLLQTRKHSVRD